MHTSRRYINPSTNRCSTTTMTPTTARHSTAAAALTAVVALLVLAAGGGLRGAEAGEADAGDCGLAQTAFSDCTAYVAGLEEKVSPRCCTGLGDIRDMAPAAAQRRTLCACILSEMLAVGKVNAGRVAGLPAACGVTVGFMPTSPDFDCSQIP